MNSLATLTDLILLSETQRRVLAERSATLSVLHCLREIEARQLFAREGYASLFEMCRDRFGYSEAAALRRIDAMRLLKAVPALLPKVESGELKLSQMSQVQTFLKVERKDAGKVYTPEQTFELAASLTGCSTRETERRLLGQSPSLQARRETSESIRPVTATHTEVKIVADEELMSLLEEARSLFAHGADMHPSAASLFKRGLQALVAQKKKQKRIPEQTGLNSLPTPEFSVVAEKTPAALPSPELLVPTTRYIPQPLRRAVYARALGRCEFTTRPGVRCTSRHALELHHLNPYARGGEHSYGNLALHCRTHNAAAEKAA